jgi:hypothetical protein
MRCAPLRGSSWARSWDKKDDRISNRRQAAKGENRGGWWRLSGDGEQSMRGGGTMDTMSILLIGMLGTRIWSGIWLGRTAPRRPSSAQVVVEGWVPRQARSGWHGRDASKCTHDRNDPCRLGLVRADGVACRQWWPMGGCNAADTGPHREWSSRPQMVRAAGEAGSGQWVALGWSIGTRRGRESWHTRAINVALARIWGQRWLNRWATQERWPLTGGPQWDTGNGSVSGSGWVNGSRSGEIENDFLISFTLFQYT